MNSPEQIENNTSLYFYIKGSRQLTNIFWAAIVTSGGLGFFLSGLSSFFKINLLLFTDSTTLTFIPQGIILVFYGTVGLWLGIFLWLTVYWDVGYGYNEFSKEKQKVTIYRQGFPGKNREIVLGFDFNQLRAIKMFIQDGLNPKRQLFLCLQDNREIPLTGNDRPIALSALEMEALNISRYLNISLETE